MKIHQQKLEAIAGRNLNSGGGTRASVAGPKVAKAMSKDIKKFNEDKKRSKDFLSQEKNLMISKDNQILLSKLVEISSGKWSMLPPITNAPKRAQSQTRVFQP